MINEFKKLVIYIINMPLYLLFKTIPKDKKIWIFGAWFGNKYSDNSKYLFEYINKFQPDIRAIWLSNDSETVSIIKSKGFEAYKTYSLKGYVFSSRSLVSFVSTSFNDVNHFIPTKSIVNLWHGNPLKKIVYDDKINNQHRNNSKHKLLKFFFPFVKSAYDYTYIISSSELESKNLETAFLKDSQSILLTGLPRNDVFNRVDSTKSLKKIIYMPTHRNQGELDISSFFLEELEYINNYLYDLDITLYVKLHFYHLNNLNSDNKSNIIFMRDEDIEQDIYSVINSFDLLITDYSSIYFDYLLTDNPIIFAPFDYDNYITQDRELYYDYDEVTPGPKCNNWNEVLDWIVKFKENNKLFENERKMIKDKFHKYQDDKSCERVYQEIKRLDFNRL